MANLFRLFKDFGASEHAIASVEYALLLALIGGGILGGALALQAAVSGNMSDASTCIDTDGADC